MIQSLCRAPWTVALVLLSVLATAAHLLLPAGEVLVCTPERLRSGQLWLLIVGPLVHAGMDHAIRDLGLLWMLGWIFEPSLGRRALPVLLLSTATAPLVAFASEPALVAYFGTSSTVHGLVAAALVMEWQGAGGRPPLWIAALSLIIPLVLVAELSSGPTLFHLDLGPGVRSVPLTHLAGFVSGALCMSAPRICLWPGLSRPR